MEEISPAVRQALREVGKALTEGIKADSDRARQPSTPPATGTWKPPILIRESTVGDVKSTIGEAPPEPTVK